MKVWVELKGCDESTHVEIDGLTAGDRRVLERLAELTEAESSSDCEPRLIVHKGPMPE